ncbi:RcnB family protein [Erythrobacter sp. LQ02-29]|uniref:RcnB family protein n=1 Tax=Erythrobacter sp. LQ02-29 TaxID=2920384 RepID=UPI00211AAFA1|nr:RcnB family protein [Erythrobacter sp. LQ02-29]MCP9223722.1 RcnB family protein [Erythrobacter sp. LQ02-29]
MSLKFLTNTVGASALALAVSLTGLASTAHAADRPDRPSERLEQRVERRAAPNRPQVRADRGARATPRVSQAPERPTFRSPSRTTVDRVEVRRSSAGDRGRPVGVAPRRNGSVDYNPVRQVQARRDAYDARRDREEAARQRQVTPAEQRFREQRTARYGNREDRRDNRYDRRNDRRDDRAERRDDRRDGRYDRRDDRRDWRNDRRDNRHDWRNDRRDGRYDRDHRSWNRGWRSDRRYNWQYYRNAHRNQYRLGRYYAPYRGYSYRRLNIGFRLGSLFFGSRYWINDPSYYRLPPAYGPYRWVRYYDDALLVNTYTGQVVDVIYSFFW